MSVTGIESITVRNPLPERSQSLELAALALSLSKAQAEIRNVTKDQEAQGAKWSYTYADLASVWDACRGPLSANGLAVIQQPVGDGKRIGVTTTLLHESGQFMTSTLYAMPSDTGPQAIGVVITYLRRYSLMSVAGLAGEDTDAAGVAGNPNVDAPANDNAKSARRAAPPRAPDGPPPPSSSGPTLVSQRKYRRLAEAQGISGDEARARVIKCIGRTVAGLQDLTQPEMDHVIATMEGDANASA